MMFLVKDFYELDQDIDDHNKGQLEERPSKDALPVGMVLLRRAWPH